MVYHGLRRGEAFAQKPRLISVASMLGIPTYRDLMAAKRASPLPFASYILSMNLSQKQFTIVVGLGLAFGLIVIAGLALVATPLPPVAQLLPTASARGAAPATAAAAARGAAPTMATPTLIVYRRPTRTPTPTIDPQAPTATPCQAEWCSILGVQMDAQAPQVPTPASARSTALGYAIQIHGCGANSKSESIRLVGAADFNWVKQQVRWEEIEGVKGKPGWGCVDEVVNTAQATGLNVLLSINTAPTWARTAAGAPQAAAFADFAAQVARRYKGRVAAIEVFNEPNLAIEWGPRIDPAGYATMLAAAYPRIKQVDPSIMVISAGLAPTRWNDWGAALDDLKYLRAIAGTLKTSADCVGIHYNDGRASPLAAGSTFQQIIGDYRAIIDKPLCMTEFGIAAPLPGQKPPAGFEWSANTTDMNAAHWLVEGFTWAQQHPGVFQLIVVWNLDYYSGPEDPNALYALLNRTELRPAYEALRLMEKK
jgi:polysaccharide biosynthesis protein PslG